MKVCVIGTGYVGLVVGTCLAEMGNNVICVDNNKEKLSQLKKGIIPIYEPNLEELIKNNVKENRLEFSCDLKSSVQKSLICYIAVGTPQKEDGSADLKYVFEVANEIGCAINDYKVIVDKSTVPVGTADKITEIIKSKTNIEFDVISNPEFLKQGSAVCDFLKPDRIVIGSNSSRATKIIQELYNPYVRTGNPIIMMDVKSAEMTKYASNSFLALKISYINEIANICEKTGADIEKVRLGMMADKRIGSQFLFAGLGFGGSCFPKDVKALEKTAIDYSSSHRLLSAIQEVNKEQRINFLNKILTRFNNNIKGKVFGVWGLSFKPDTNDMREAPSITIIGKLLEKGGIIKVYDPKALDEAKRCFKDKVEYSKTSYDALQNADCMLLLTEWREFRRPDFVKMKNIMKTPLIFDGRNQYNKQILNELGFEYISIGK